MFFFDDTPIYERALEVRRRVDTSSLLRLQYPKKPRNMASNPLALPAGSEVVFDVECFHNYFMVGFKHLQSGLYFFAEMREGTLFPCDLVNRAMHHFKCIGFNSRTYDVPMIEAAIKGYSLSELKELSDKIIKDNERTYSFNTFNHVDLFEVAPLEGSLKLYMARLHGERIQELPYSEDIILSDDEIDETIEYNFNDLDGTELLYLEPKYGLKPHIEMREMLGREIDEDIRSKSDAQVAEAFINARLKAITGRRPQTPTFPDGYNFKYQPPALVKFQTPQLQAALDRIRNATFYLDPKNKRPMMPPELDGLAITLGNCVHRMGLGGLHSSEKTVAHFADEENDLIDSDVASYYPWLIINNEWYPEHLGRVFLEIYRDDLVLRRLALKKIKDKLEAGLKIAINGTFGKLGNVYSTIYSPNLLMQVTITGQLGLLMLIEMFELEGIPVASANTDGVVCRVPKRKGNAYKNVIGMWEQATGLQMEETRYRATYARDVNNYIAIGEDGSVKTKGTYSEKGSAQNSALSKNPEALICSDAVKAFLSAGTPIRETIEASRDIRRFVVVRNVKGGAHKDGYFLGKTVRWYYSRTTPGTIHYVLSGNKVPNSDNARPLMELGEFPADMDFELYIRRADEMLKKLGVYGNATRQVSFF